MERERVLKKEKYKYVDRKCGKERHEQRKRDY
jgi:hypothetical protein